MKNMSQSLHSRLRQAFMQYDEFSSHASLRAVFGVQELQPWRNGLPEADSLRNRADFTIDYLHDKRNSSGRSALVLLLEVLRDRCNPDDGRYQGLLDLIQQLEPPIQPVSPTSPERSDRSEASKDVALSRTPSQIRDILITYFNETELRNLCFDMQIDYESLAGSGKADKARELVLWCQRHQRYDELVVTCQNLRPNAFKIV